MSPTDPGDPCDDFHLAAGSQHDMASFTSHSSPATARRAVRVLVLKVSAPRFETCLAMLQFLWQSPRAKRSAVSIISKTMLRSARRMPWGVCAVILPRGREERGREREEKRRERRREREREGGITNRSISGRDSSDLCRFSKKIIRE